MWALDLLAAHVQGYSHRNGTDMRPHLRTHPDGNPFNDYGFPGDDHPNSGDIPPGDQGHHRDRD
jgi:hypothetical protein